MLTLETKTEEHYNFFKSHFEFPITLGEFLTSHSKIFALRNTSIEGLVSYTQVNKERIHINFIVVNNKKQGLGTKLLNAVKEKNCNITCNVREQNLISLNFFKKHGFVEIDKDTYKNGDIKIMLQHENGN